MMIYLELFKHILETNANNDASVFKQNFVYFLKKSKREWYTHTLDTIIKINNITDQLDNTSCSQSEGSAIIKNLQNHMSMI